MAVSSNTTELRPFRPADVCRLQEVVDVAMHPDGGDVVYVLSWPDLESDSNRSVLYRVGADGSDRVRLTEGHRDHSPWFSPDGTRLAFIRSQPGEPGRVMVLDWPTGELTDVARSADGGPSALAWVDDRRLVALAPQRPAEQNGLSDEELARRPRVVASTRYRFNGRGYINDRPNQLWLIDVDGDGAAAEAGTGADGDTDGAGALGTPIGRAGVDHGSFAVSPDGTSVAAVAFSDPDTDLTGANRIWLYPLTVDSAADADVTESAAARLLTPEPGQWDALDWAGSGLVAVGGDEPTETRFNRIFSVDLSGAAKPEVVAYDDLSLSSLGLAGRTIARRGGDLFAPGHRHGRVAIDRYDLADGGRQAVYDEEAQVMAFDVDRDGQVVVAAITSVHRPAELWRIDVEGGTATKLVSLNDEVLAGLDLAPMETVQVASADGAVVEAFITRPPASAPDTGAARPGLVYVHGGPMSLYGHRFFDEFQVAAGLGYVVIGGNPRGSDGYGEEWARAIMGDYGNLDWQDVQALTGHLADLSEVDGDRIGIGGGSYGGFVTGWALSHDTEGVYKAGLVERAVTDWRSMYGTSDIGMWFTARNIGSTVEDDLDGVLRQSPLSHAARVQAPTLIIHSEEDWRCPIEQAEQLFAALRRNGTDVVLARFPGENHEMSRGGSPRHRIERFEIIHEFFARHLGGADLDTSHLPH